MDLWWQPKENDMEKIHLVFEGRKSEPVIVTVWAKDGQVFWHTGIGLITERVYILKLSKERVLEALRLHGWCLISDIKKKNEYAATIGMAKILQSEINSTK